QRLRTEILRLVDDQHDPPALGMRRQQVMTEQIHQRLDAAATRLRHRHAQLFADRQQELGRRNPRVQDQRNVGVLGQLLEQAADDRRLAGADLTRELDETTGLVDAVEQVRERLRVPLAQIQVAWVRGDRERLFVQAKKARVHAELRTRPRG